VTQTEAQLERARIEFDRNKKLFEEKVISDAAFLQAQTDFKVAQQEVNSARQNLEAARYLIQSAEAGLRDAQENLRKTTILAPVSGTISKLDVELGERVVGTSQMAGTEMLRIANLNNMEVRVDVNENDIVRVGVGDTAIIDVDSYSSMEKTFRGIVTEIANTANETVSQDAVTEFQVKVRILNESYKDLTSKNKKLSPFRPGMTASVDIVTARKSNVLSVPLAAVTTRNPDAPKGTNRDSKGGQGENNQNNQGGAQPAPGTPVKPEELKEVVFVNKAGKAQMRLVRTGISDYDNIEIITGLKEGEEIVAGPYMVVSKRLNDGDAVAQRKADEKVAKGPGNP
jgi:HlyD family secretion protein